MRINEFNISNGPNPASFCLFLFFLHDKYSTNTINDKSVDGVLGTQTQGDRMVGTDESTELWHPMSIIFWHCLAEKIHLGPP